MKRVICFTNEKGGSGKTTLAVNIAAYLAGKGEKTLILDMDPQGHVGKSLGLDVAGLKPSVADLLLDPGVSLGDVAVAAGREGLWVAPSNKLLTDFTVNAASHPDRALKLRQKIEPEDGFDFILIDSPPSLGLLTINLLMASTEVVIPVSLTYLALDGLVEMLDTIDNVKERLGHRELSLSLVAPTFYRENVLVNSIMGRLRERFGPKAARTALEYDMRIDQAQSFGKSVFEFAPESEGARQIAQLAEELIRAHGQKA
ncbi:MAG: ParA family protein [Candidatus Nitrospinota bacterium M3_3B_026]